MVDSSSQSNPALVKMREGHEMASSVKMKDAIPANSRISNQRFYSSEV